VSARTNRINLLNTCTSLATLVSVIRAAMFGSAKTSSSACLCPDDALHNTNLSLFSIMGRSSRRMASCLA
jgi:hypothetical protein